MFRHSRLGPVYAKSCVISKTGGEVQEAQIHRVELVEPREKAPAALESPEQPLEHVAARPAAELGVDRGPVAEPLRQGAPLAVALQDVQNRIDDCDVGNPHVSARFRAEPAGRDRFWRTVLP